MSNDPEVLEVGVVGRAHGLRGEVYVNLVTDRTERLEPGGACGPASDWLTVVSAKPHQHRWIVVFDGLHTREQAERYTSSKLFAEPIDDPEALWVHDLVGAEVRTTDGATVGICSGVVANPASDLLELDSGVLVPIRFVTSFEDGIVVIDPPLGLLDLDDADDASGG
ncbi:MAG: ribosome maturation factor RimM [Ilumatobacteraceae bacterium]